MFILSILGHPKTRKFENYIYMNEQSELDSKTKAARQKVIRPLSQIHFILEYRKYHYGHTSETNQQKIADPETLGPVPMKTGPNGLVKLTC